MPLKTTGLTESQSGFANGLTESLISTLSGYNAITVLSSGTSYYTTEKNMDDKSIVDNFGVNYIIRGFMQVMGESARLHLEITDIKTSQVIVSKKRDFDLNEIFAVQDELTNSILDEMQIGLGVGSQ